eukprot:27597-Chlamydomonas_euryale.AAC.6
MPSPAEGRQGMCAGAPCIRVFALLCNGTAVFCFETSSFLPMQHYFLRVASIGAGDLSVYPYIKQCLETAGPALQQSSGLRICR